MLNFQLLPPADWQAFERLCRTLFQELWNDPQTSLNGRSGQRQNGVDVFGKDLTHNTGLHGVQCKGKDRNYGGKVTAKELRQEVEKAKQFKPPLKCFTLVTTAPDDVKIQEAARLLSEENKKSGLFEVAVWGWGNLSQHIHSNKQLMEKVLRPVTIVAEILSKDEASQRVNTVTQPSAVAASNASSTVSTKLLDEDISVSPANLALHRELDRYRDLLRQSKATTALMLLEAFREKEFPSADDHLKFRIITNIGASKLQLNRIEEAANDFIEASSYDPDSKLSLGNLILAHTFLRRNDVAQAEAIRALQKYPNDPSLTARYINSLTSVPQLDSALSTYSADVLENSEVALAIAAIYERYGAADKFIRWAKIAYDNDTDKHDEVSHAYARSLLSGCFDSIAAHTIGVQTISERDNLASAVDILGKIWNNCRASELAAAQLSIAANLANALRLIGATDEALNIVNQGLAFDATNTDLLGIRASIKIGRDDFAGAVADLSADGLTGELLLKRGYALSQMGRHDEARNCLSSAEAITDDPKIILTARLLSINTLHDEGKKDLAASSAIALHIEQPDSIECAALAARMLRGAERSSEALDILNRAAKTVTIHTLLLDRYVLAQEYLQLNEHHNALRLLTGKVDTQFDSPSLRLLLHILVETDNRKQFGKIIEQLGADCLGSPYYQNIRALYYERIGQLAEAIGCLEQYMSNHPTDIRARLNWISLKARTLAENDIRTYLQGNPDVSLAPPKYKAQYAHVMAQFGFVSQALELAYHTLRQNRDDVTVHSLYVGLLLSPGIEENLPRFDSVQAGCAFTLVDRDGKRTTYTIMDSGDASPSHFELSPSEALAIRASGKKIGDDVEFHVGRALADTRKIENVDSKYVAAFRYSRAALEEQFTDSGVVESVPVGNGPDGLANIIEITKAICEQRSSILEMYKTTLLPISFLAAAANSDVITTYHGLMNEGIKIKVCQGSHEERRIAFVSAGENMRAGCIVDALTLYLIRRLNLATIVERILGKINITQSTLDLFISLRNETRSYISKGKMSVSYSNGQLYRTEVPPDDVKKYFQLLVDDIKWLEKDCSIIPATGDVGFLQKAQGRLLERSATDTLSALADNKLIFLCEDYGLRQLALAETGKLGIWLQPALMLARRQSVLRPDAPRIMARPLYESYLSTAISCGHEFTSIDSDDLKFFFANDPQKFKLLLATLSSRNSETSSAVLVAMTFLLHLNRQQQVVAFPDIMSVLCSPERTALLDDTLINILSWIRETKARCHSPEETFSLKAIKDLLAAWHQGHFWV